MSVFSLTTVLAQYSHKHLRAIRKHKINVILLTTKKIYNDEH
ncbi:hypothetical protein PRABACTJOHN_03320 [Parabacteroides johnsonii DSM 18315]|uniref:Uncharacterized protein n=1 Tax=Parabacteroides johnsonii DSM 18315 TaxID=537006 RepID=B7BE43_9BACT|nr:hypothetical protein PRABACTJOHN_03320 [Parabacteroides johnsonii DSM 18315]